MSNEPLEGTEEPEIDAAEQTAETPRASLLTRWLGGGKKELIARLEQTLEEALMLKTQLAQASEENAALQVQLSKVASRCRTAEATLESFRHERDDAAKRAAEATNELEAAACSRDQLRVQNEELRNQHKHLDARLAAADERCRKTAEINDAYRERLKQLKRQAENHEAAAQRCVPLEADIQRMQEELSADRRERERMQGELEEHKRELQKRKRELAAAHAQLAEREQTLSELEEARNRASSSTAALEALQQQLEARSESDSEQLGVLRDQLAQRTEELETLREAFSAQRSELTAEHEREQERFTELRARQESLLAQERTAADTVRADLEARDAEVEALRSEQEWLIDAHYELERRCKELEADASASTVSASSTSLARRIIRVSASMAELGFGARARLPWRLAWSREVKRIVAEVGQATPASMAAWLEQQLSEAGLCRSFQLHEQQSGVWAELDFGPCSDDDEEGKARQREMPMLGELAAAIFKEVSGEPWTVQVTHNDGGQQLRLSPRGKQAA